jgi:hypothetical protein
MFARNIAFMAMSFVSSPLLRLEFGVGGTQLGNVDADADDLSRFLSKLPENGKPDRPVKQ